jgi:hypothetical protein
MRFYLGTHEPSWLIRTAHPLFISRHRLARLQSVVKYRPTFGPWALDSGGFTELNLFGRWETTPGQYAEEVLRWQSEIGSLDWAAIQDWMCEPWVLGKTGRTVAEHQERSVQSLLDLRALAPSAPWAPVLQGWHPNDYLRCAELYRSAGVDLQAEPVVGVGTLCRRQAGQQAEDILLTLKPLGLKLHGFGLKVGFLKRAVWGSGLASFDSLAWSFRARRSDPLPGCTHKSCANCFRFAMRWSDEIVRIGHRPKQLVMI